MAPTPPQPHRDPETWSELIAGLPVERFLVVFSTWLGPRLRSSWSAEDIWQETLLMAWRDRSAHEWSGVQDYRRWLFAIARNRVRDAVTTATAQKRGGERRTTSLSALGRGADDSEFSVGLPPDTLTPSRVYGRMERVQSMHAALDSLPEVYRDAVRLRVFEEFRLEEVARALDVSLATAKKRIYLGAELYTARLRDRMSRSALGSWG